MKRKYTLDEIEEEWRDELFPWEQQWAWHNVFHRNEKRGNDEI